MFTKIKKRNGNAVQFDSEKITNAILKAGKITGEFEEPTAKKLCLQVMSIVEATEINGNITVEHVQDILAG